MNKHITNYINNSIIEIEDESNKSINIQCNNSNGDLIAENPSHNIEKIIYELDISHAIKNMKDRYSQLNLFKYVSYFGGSINIRMLTSFIDYLKENPNKGKDIVLDSNCFFDGPDEKKSSSCEFSSFTILDEDFGLVLRRHYVGNESLVLLFFNDKNLLKTKFFDKTTGKLDSGIYEMIHIDNRGHSIIEIDIKNIALPILNDNTFEQLESDIDCFLSNKSFYEKYNFLYKLGILIYGGPGNGKTTLIKYLLSKHINLYNLIVNVSKFNDEVIEMINDSFPKDKNKILVFEDVECLPSYQRSSFLNFIDGVRTLDNCIFIATTNYPEKVDPALINRPSRFDKIYKINYPKDNTRKELLIKYFPSLSNNKLSELIEKTKDFSCAYFIELFKMVEGQKIKMDDAIDRLNQRIKISKSGKYNNDGTAIGFLD